MFDGSSIDGFVRIEESDMYLKPDVDSFAIFPWRPQQGRVARLICDVYTTNGEPYGGCRNALKEFWPRRKRWATMNVGPELGSSSSRRTAKASPPSSRRTTAAISTWLPSTRARMPCDVCLMLEEMGFEIETSHHEVAEGQHEIDFKYADALTTADNIMTFKIVVKSIAARHGLYATFMPKPIFGINGSGMHQPVAVHQRRQRLLR